MVFKLKRSLNTWRNKYYYSEYSTTGRENELYNSIDNIIVEQILENHDDIIEGFVYLFNRYGNKPDCELSKSEIVVKNKLVETIIGLYKEYEDNTLKKHPLPW